MRNFSFKLKDEVVRGMNREQYKSASHWVRWCAWKVDKMISWDVIGKSLYDKAIMSETIYVPDMGIAF